MAFYRPTEKRNKILIEKKAFPSDHYAMESQIRLKGLDPDECLLTVGPREGEHTVRTSDILDIIEKNGDSIAVVALSGVQYYTGQLFDIETITSAAHKKGCMVGWDLAHATGNVPLKLHDWDVDFACWCTYKYLNSGPGGIAGIFVHQKHATDLDRPRMTGWWSHKVGTRFEMTNKMDLNEGAAGFEISNPCILASASLLGSLEIFERAGMYALREKSLAMTAYLEFLIKHNFSESEVEIITPENPDKRGCQLSLLIKQDFDSVFEHLMSNGVICDERKPDCIRVAPVPLYNTYQDVWRFIEVLKVAFSKQ
ncbi:hypothetical protein H4219_002506 [Mycoemilia scoparia]|uniref:Abnormal fluorescence under UV illumination n=1 Tax=Mycoemilia scoparia TaxID=417184 RepID=A0A9W7ZY28_9FUNG|nr:hypothetical protein H4219_002506 [Mycoemilia scoparia]